MNLRLAAAAMDYYRAYYAARKAFAGHAGYTSPQMLNRLERAEIDAHAKLIEACAQDDSSDDEIEKVIVGALESTIDSRGATVHGSWLGSAAKRIRGQLQSVMTGGTRQSSTETDHDA